MLKAKAQESIAFLPLKVSHKVRRAGGRPEKVPCVYCFLFVFEALFSRDFWLFHVLFVFTRMSLLKRQPASLTGVKLAHVLG